MSFHGLIAHFFIALNNTSLSGCTTTCFCINIEELLGGLQVLATKYANNCCCKLPCASVFMDTSFQLFGQIPWSKIAGLYGNSIFSFVRNCQTVLQNGCTILYSHEQGSTVPIIIPHPHQNLVLDCGRQLCWILAGKYNESVHTC